MRVSAKHIVRGCLQTQRWANTPKMATTGGAIEDVEAALGELREEIEMAVGAQAQGISDLF